MKTHYTCMNYVRGKSKHGCHQTIRAGAYDHKTLRKAGWKSVRHPTRDFWRCPVCAS